MLMLFADDDKRGCGKFFWRVSFNLNTYPSCCQQGYMVKRVLVPTIGVICTFVNVLFDPNVTKVTKLDFFHGSVTTGVTSTQDKVASLQ